MAMLVKSSPYVIGSASPWVRQAWTTTPVAYDILANGPSGGGANQQWGYACRKIIVGSAGTLVYTDPSGNVQTLTCVAGEPPLEIEAIALSATSTCTNVKVFW